MTWLVFFLVALTPGAMAQGPSDDERARGHFEAGHSYHADGDYERALDEFVRAYELSGRVLLLVNIANCEERLGMWTEAAEHLAAYVATLPPDTEEVATLNRRIGHLRERAARGASREEPPLPDGPALPDADAVDASAIGPTPASAATPGSDGLLVPALITFGASAALAVAWATLGGLALAERDAIAAECGATRTCSSERVGTLEGLAIGADVTMTLTLVAAATAVVLLVVDPPRGSGAGELAVLPVVSPDGAALVVGGAL